MAITEEMRAVLAQKLEDRRNGGRKVDREDVVKRYLSGDSVATIARDLRVTVACIYVNLRQAAKAK